MKPLDFYKQMAGLWVSDRTFFYPENNSFQRTSTEVNIFPIENADTIRLQTHTSTIDLMFRGHNSYHRSKHGTDQLIKVEVIELEKNRMLTTYTYNDIYYSERYAFLDKHYTTRNLIGKRDDNIVLIGNYIEYYVGI